MLCTFVAILFLIIYQSIATKAVSEEQVLQTGQNLGNSDDLGTHDHENQIITPKSLWGNKRSRSKTQKYGPSVTATSDLVTQEVKENASGKKPRKRTKIKVRSEKELERHRKNMRVYREKRRLDPRREEEFKQKVSKQKREKLIEVHKNPVELANHRERRKEVNQRYRQNRKAKNDAANTLSSLKSSLS